jgi:hypothetical protein
MSFVTDYIINGAPQGAVAEAMSGVRFDPGLMRPYYDAKGRPSVTVNTGRMVTRKDDKGQPVVNKRGEPILFPEYRQELIANLVARGVQSPVFNSTTLRRDEWMMIDTAVIRASRDRLRAWADLSQANTFGGFNGMSKLGLVRESMTDPGQAVVDMDGMTPGQADGPLFTPDILPLPITHADFWLSSRRLAESRNTGTPLDTTLAEACGRRVAEAVEKMTIGKTDLSSLVVGTSSEFTRRGVYGYITHPDRITKTDLTTPTGSNPDDVLQDVLEMRQLAYAQKFFGPFMLYHSTDYDTYLDNDYYDITTSGAVAPTQTLRERIKKIEGITDVRRLDLLDNTFTLILVQMTSDVCRAVNGMDITTLQWESHGGMRINFKVMAIQVPDIRAQYVGTSTSTRKVGIVHATTG